MNKNNSKTTPYVMTLLFLLAGMVFFGSATPVSKLVGEDFPVIGAAGCRFLLAALALLPFAFFKTKELFQLQKRDWLLVAGVAVIGNIGFTVFLLYGMKMISGVLGSVIMSMAPAITAIAAVLFFKEKLGKEKIAALILGVAGVLILQISSGAGASGSNIWMGVLLVFLAICCEALYTLMGKAATQDIMTPLKLTTLSSLFAGVLLLPWVISEFVSLSYVRIDLESWLALLWWGLGTMGLGSVLWYSGVSRVPGHVAAGFMIIMPVSALVLSYVLLGESFEWIHIPGFGLALTGTGSMAFAHYKREKQNK